MDINKFYESYEKPEFIDERLENVVSALPLWLRLIWLCVL